LDNPLFVLFDGNITDIVQVQDILNNIGQEYVAGKSEFKNVVIVAHRFADTVLSNFAFNFSNPNTINVVPLATPMFPMVNGQLHFLMDLAAFTGARIFNMTKPLAEATPDDLGKAMNKIEIHRFRTTISGEPDPLNVEVRAEEIKSYINQVESKIEKNILEDRLGKLTSGIARLKIYGSSNGELKEKADRAEDAVCAVRAAITHGCLPGGCRVLINLALGLQDNPSPVVQEVLIPSLFAPFHRLLENAGYNEDEVKEILTKMISKTNVVFDVENAVMGDFKKMGVYDAASAVEQALKNAVSISSVMGTLGGIVAFPRDHQLENQDAKDAANFQRTLDNAQGLANEANERF
jgi:chaperonin GroEL